MENENTFQVHLEINCKIEKKNDENFKYSFDLKENK